jgi:hypothetical protein
MSKIDFTNREHAPLWILVVPNNCLAVVTTWGQHVLCSITWTWTPWEGPYLVTTMQSINLLKLQRLLFRGRLFIARATSRCIIAHATNRHPAFSCPMCSKWVYCMKLHGFALHERDHTLLRSSPPKEWASFSKCMCSKWVSMASVLVPVSIACAALAGSEREIGT